MKLYNIAKPEELFKRLDSLKGDVQVTMPDGRSFGWRQSGAMFKSIVSALPEQRLDDVEVKTENDEDTVRMINYLMRSEVG